MRRISAFLEERSVDHELIRHPATYNAQRLAEAVGVSGHEVAKTVLLKSDVDFILAVLPATQRVNVDAVQHVALADTMALAKEEEIAAKFTDCETGAVPPFGSHYGILTLLDEALAQSDMLVFDCETHEEAIRMKMTDYISLEAPTICEIGLPSKDG